MEFRSVTLYTIPGSSSQFPHILLNEVGIPYMTKAVDRKIVTTEWTATNAKGQVPVLDIDGNLVTENPAIAHAISLMAPQRKIMGRTEWEFIRVCEWLNFVASSIHAQTWGPMARPWRFSTDPAAQDGIKAKSAEKLRDRFAIIEAKLPDQGWAVGEGFTAVDAYLCYWGNLTVKAMNVDMAAEYPKWAQLLQKLNGLESVRKTMADEDKMREEMDSKGQSY